MSKCCSLQAETFHGGEPEAETSGQSPDTIPGMKSGRTSSRTIYCKTSWKLIEFLKSHLALL